jgi:hypothetical protein
MSFACARCGTFGSDGGLCEPCAALELESDRLATAAMRLPSLCIGLLGGLGVAFGSGLLVSVYLARYEPHSSLFYYGGPIDQFLGLVGISVVAASAWISFVAWQMRQLRRWRASTIAAGLLLLPCITGPAWVVAIPLGLWTLALLRRDEVRSRFT